MKKNNSIHICNYCGRDSQSQRVGSYIINGAKSIRKADQQTDALNIIIPLKRSLKKPENYARLTFNPWK